MHQHMMGQQRLQAGCFHFAQMLWICWQVKLPRQRPRELQAEIFDPPAVACITQLGGLRKTWLSELRARIHLRLENRRHCHQPKQCQEDSASNSPAQHLASISLRHHPASLVSHGR